MKIKQAQSTANLAHHGYREGLGQAVGLLLGRRHEAQHQQPSLSSGPEGPLLGSRSTSSSTTPGP